MATTSNSGVEQIGTVAGAVWKALNKEGSLSMTKLVKAIGQPRDTVMQGVGWLAREGKVRIEGEGRSRIISLN